MSRQPLLSFEKKVTESIDELERILFDMKEGTFTFTSPFILAGTGTGILKKDGAEFVAQYGDGHRSFIAIDKIQHSISVRGEWWYCGVYTLRPESSTETTIIYQVFNAAKNLRWLVPLATMNLDRDEKNFNLFVESLLKQVRTARL